MPKWSGRAGDVACARCARPLKIGQTWKKRLASGKVLYYCAEDVIVFDEGRSWRPRTDKDPLDLPPMGEKVKVAEPNAGDDVPLEAPAAPPEMPMKSWVDVADSVLEAKANPPADAPRFEDEWQGSYDVEKPADDDFDPINDVGF